MKKKISIILFFFIILFLVALLILGIQLINKHLIIKNISQKLTEYKTSNNFYVEAIPQNIEKTKYFYYKLNEKRTRKK